MMFALFLKIVNCLVIKSSNFQTLDYRIWTSIFKYSMRPLSLKGHERALTRVRFNREGDLLFSAAKDKEPCVWYTENGERLGGDFFF